MENWKVPGYDGIIMDFFKKYWFSVGLDILRAVLDFFSSGFIFKEINRTIILLILKIKVLE